MTIFFVALTYLVLSIITFGKLILTFFQQDEWVIFGNYLYWNKAGLNWFNRLFIFQQYTHIVPFSNFLSYVQFSIFGLNFVPYAVVGVILHTLNSFLVYKLTDVLVKNKKIAFLSGLVFLVNSITQQTVTWIATTTGTAGSTFFILLSLIFFTQFLKNNKRRRDLLMSCLFLLASLLFNEISLFCFLFFPLLWLVYSSKKDFRDAIKTFLPFVVLGIGYVLFRLYFFLFGYHTTSAPQELSQPGLMVYAFRLFTSPFKFLTQSIVPVGFIISLATIIVQLGYPHFVQSKVADPYVVETVASDIVSYGIAFMVIIVCFALANLKKIKEFQLDKTFIVSSLFIGLSSIPFLFIPGKGGYFSLLDGRHLYLTSIFTSILVASVFFALYEISKKKKAISMLICLMLLAYIGLNALQIRKDLNKQVANAYIRKYILNTINSSYPTLPDKVIFYTENDTSYYGLPITEPILPFQSGFGQTLLVWYNAKGENFPACFFKDQFLYVLESEGYRECDGRGFGYYRKLDLLKSAVAVNKLSAQNVIAFRFYSQKNEIADITGEVRQKIK